MQSKTFIRWTVYLTVLGIAAAPVLATTQDDESERRVFVDVRAEGPVWSFLEGGYLGINMVELTPELRAHFGVPEDTGVMISSIAEDSPAADSGLRVGDILTAIDGDAVSGTRAVVRAVGSRKGGDAVTLEVFREGGYTTLDATLAEHERRQFWLDRFGDEVHSGFEFHSEDGENVFVLPAPDAEGLMIRREKMDELMGTLHERLASPEFSERMFEVRSNTEELEKRIKELEARLAELARKLEESED